MDIKPEILDESERQGTEYSRKLIEEYDTLWGDAYWDYIRRQRAVWMMKLIATRKPELTAINALEIGCGIGFTTFEVAAFDAIARIKALDISEEALKIAARLQRENTHPSSRKIEFVHGDFFKVDEAGTYDLVYTHEVFEHILSGDAVFEKVFNLLKPGGIFVISTPNRARFMNRIRSITGKHPVLIDPFHVREYTLGEMLVKRDGWRTVASTARQLIDEQALGLLMSLGSKRLFKIVYPAARTLCRNRIMFSAGRIFPPVSSELWIMYERSQTCQP